MKYLHYTISPSMVSPWKISHRFSAVKARNNNNAAESGSIVAGTSAKTTTRGGVDTKAANLGMGKYICIRIYIYIYNYIYISHMYIYMYHIIYIYIMHISIIHLYVKPGKLGRDCWGWMPLRKNKPLGGHLGGGSSHSSWSPFLDVVCCWLRFAISGNSILYIYIYLYL
jgi:hypothetical protein